jgi:DNA-binding CsgD family transcriptional regulator
VTYAKAASLADGLDMSNTQTVPVVPDRQWDPRTASATLRLLASPVGEAGTQSAAVASLPGMLRLPEMFDLFRQAARQGAQQALEQYSDDIRRSLEQLVEPVTRRTSDSSAVHAAAVSIGPPGRSERRLESSTNRISLTPRECNILELIRHGLSTKEIARRLGITPETVKSHVKRAFVKLGVNKRSTAVWYAQRLGFLTAPSGVGAVS